MKRLLLAASAIAVSVNFAIADTVTITLSDSLGNATILGPDSTGFFNPSITNGSYNVS
jgi:hypothetical protein